MNVVSATKGNESEAGENAGNETNDIMITALIYCVKIIIAVRVVRRLRSLLSSACVHMKRSEVRARTLWRIQST